MTWRRRQRRRLIWAGALLGLVLLLATVSVVRVAVWTRDLLLSPDTPDWRGAHR
jgi:hypothetical protein